MLSDELNLHEPEGARSAATWLPPAGTVEARRATVLLIRPDACLYASGGCKGCLGIVEEGATDTGSPMRWMNVEPQDFTIAVGDESDDSAGVLGDDGFRLLGRKDLDPASSPPVRVAAPAGVRAGRKAAARTGGRRRDARPATRARGRCQAQLRRRPWPDVRSSGPTERRGSPWTPALPCPPMPQAIA